jgi:hypothetical protein
MPITRGSGFIIGYDLGIIFYHFKKRGQKDKEKFWIMARLQKKIYRAMIPLVGIIGLIVFACLLSALDGQIV